MSRFETDLTKGSVSKKLIVFAAPFVLSNLIQSLYSVVDMIIIGNFTSSLTGVSTASQLTMLFTNAVIGLSVGGTVLIGQYLGGGRKDEIKSVIGTMFTVLLAIGVLLTAISPFVAKPLLTLMKLDPAYMQSGVTYYITVMAGTVFVFAYNALAGVLRGMGDSKHPMLFVGIAAAANVVLDIVFVCFFKWDAFGAALATIISQAVSVAFCIVFLMKRDFIFDFKLRSFRVDREKLKLMLKIGTPTMLNNVCTSLSFIFLMTMANVISPDGGGAVGIVGKYNGFAILPAIGMSSSISAMVAQNFGAGDIKRVKKTLLCGTLIAEGFTACIFALTMLFPTQILSVFGDDGNVLALSTAYMLTFAFDYIIVPVQFCFNGLFIGTGHTLFALISGTCASILFRIPFCWLFGIELFGKSMKGLGLGGPIASIAATVISVVFYLSGKWMKEKTGRKQEKAAGKA